MIDLAKQYLPATVSVHGREVHIRTSFRFILSARRLLTQGDLPAALSLLLLDDIPPAASTQEVVDAITSFIAPPTTLPRNVPGLEQRAPLLDYDLDSDTIVAAFAQCYGIMLTSPQCNLHWHEFLSLLHGIRGTLLNDIISYRAYSPHKNDSPEYQSHMRRLQAAYAIQDTSPDAADTAAQAAFNAVFGSPH